MSRRSLNISNKLRFTKTFQRQNSGHFFFLLSSEQGGDESRQFAGNTWYDAAAAAKSLQLCPTLCDPIDGGLPMLLLLLKSLQSCPTLSDPIDGSPPGSAIPGILKARTLEWVAISVSNA